MDGSDGQVQCPAQRPVSGGRLGIGMLRCYRFYGHKGRLHFDATEGIEWKATSLTSCGSLCLDTITRGLARVIIEKTGERG